MGQISCGSPSERRREISPSAPLPSGSASPLTSQRPHRLASRASCDWPCGPPARPKWPRDPPGQYASRPTDRTCHSGLGGTRLPAGPPPCGPYLPMFRAVKPVLCLPGLLASPNRLANLLQLARHNHRTHFGIWCSLCARNDNFSRPDDPESGRLVRKVSGWDVCDESGRER